VPVVAARARKRDMNEIPMNVWIILAAVAAMAIVALASARRRRFCSTRRDISQREHDASLARLGFRTLREYRQSDLWRGTKQRYRRSDYPQRCLICGAREFDLHHRSYARLGAEELFDLVPLCHFHHLFLHELLDSDPEASIKDTYDFLPSLISSERSPNPITAIEPAQVGSLRRFAKRRVRSPKRRAEIKRQRHRGGQRWMPEEDAELLNGFDAGVPLDQLAERLGRGVKAVEVRLNILGRLPGG
jgi:hypothetical protein